MGQLDLFSLPFAWDWPISLTHKPHRVGVRAQLHSWYLPLNLSCISNFRLLQEHTCVLKTCIRHKGTYLDDAVSFSDAAILGCDAVRVNLKHTVDTSVWTQALFDIPSHPPLPFCVTWMYMWDLAWCKGRNGLICPMTVPGPLGTLPDCTVAEDWSQSCRPELVKRRRWLLWDTE